MADASAFTKLVPGFDFLQGLVKNAGAALPNIGQWVAPTLNPEELEKRIEELRTVQFWLEQNARMMSATIQALEVQRMTLSTLKTMNVQMGDLAESLMIRPAAAPAEAVSTPPRSRAEEPAIKPAAEAAKPAAADAAAATSPAPVVDPMQWWGALTQQFTQLAATAMKEGPAAEATQLASAMVKQSMEAATKTLKPLVPKAAAAAPAASAAPAKAAAKPAADKPAAPRKRSGTS